MAEINNSKTKTGGAFSITVKQTKATANSASYVVIAQSNSNSNGVLYYFGKDEYNPKSPATITIQHKPNTNFENIYVASGADDPRDNNFQLKYWCFPALSGWTKEGYHYKRNGNELSQYHNKEFESKVQGRITGTTITSKEYTVSIPRGTSKKGFKTIEARVYGWNTYGDFATKTVELALQTTSVKSASLKTFEVTQSDVKDKDRKISVNVVIDNPENYYNFVVKRNNTQINTGKEASEFCIDIPITREMYDSMQTFSVTIYCANGEVELTEKIKEIFIENAGVGVSYKSNPTTVKEVEEIWYKDSDGNISEVTEVWVKKGKQAVKTIK